MDSSLYSFFPFGLLIKNICFKEVHLKRLAREGNGFEGGFAHKLATAIISGEGCNVKHACVFRATFTFSANKSLSKLWPIRIVSVLNILKRTAWTSRRVIDAFSRSASVTPENLPRKGWYHQVGLVFFLILLLFRHIPTPHRCNCRLTPAQRTLFFHKIS